MVKSDLLAALGLAERARGQLGLRRVHDGAWGRGGHPPPSISDEEAFRRFIHSRGKKASPSEVPKFIKKLEEIPEIALPEEKPMKIALALAKRGLMGQFMGLWPSTKTTNDCIQRNWKPNLKHGVTCYPVG